MKRAATTETLSEYLERWAKQQQRQAAAARTTRIRSAPAFKPEPERSTLMKPITIGGRAYSWQELSQPEVRRQLLPMVEAMIAQAKADPAAFGYTAADVQAAVRYTTGEFDNLSEDRMREIFPAQEEAEVTTTLINPMTSTPPIDGATAFREVAKIVGSPEGRIALQRRANGQPLDAAQTALIQRHDAFLAANNAQALREHPPTGGMMGRADKYIPTAVRELAKLPPLEQAHAAREMAAALRKDERWTNPNHPEHAQSVHEMKLLYDAQYMEGGNEAVIKD